MKFYRCRLTWISLVWLVALASLLSRPICAETAAPSERPGTASDSDSGGKLTTVAVVAAAPFEDLLGDVTTLGTLAGRPEAGQIVEAVLQMAGPDTLDKKQPWGFIVQTDGAMFYPVGCIPVNNGENLLNMATGFGVQVKDLQDGIKELVLPNEQSGFFKQQAGWAFISPTTEALARLPEKPQVILAELVTEYDLAVRVSMKDVPEMYRQFAVHAMQAGMEQQMAAAGDGNGDEHELRRKVADAQLAQAMRTLNETDSITIGWTMDAAERRTYLDYSQTFVPGSKTARQLASYGSPRTNFAGFYQPGAAATLSFVTKADPELIQQDIEYFQSAMQVVRAGFNNGIDSSGAKDPEALKAAFGDWFDAFEATIRAGQMDGGAALQVSADSLTFVAGALVAEPAKIESGLKKLQAAAAAKYPEFPGVEWNAATHAGVNFHTFSVPIPEEKESRRQLLGDELNVAVGIGPDRVYLAVGRDNLNAVKQAIDASAAEPDKAVPPFELAVSLAPLAELAAAQATEPDRKAIAERVAETLRQEAEGRDHIRALGQVIPNGLRYRFTAEEGVLRALGAAATEAQRRALQAKQD